MDQPAPGLAALVARYTGDPESVYHTWFLHDAARLKAFRSIRRAFRRSSARSGPEPLGTTTRAPRLKP